MKTSPSGKRLISEIEGVHYAMELHTSFYNFNNLFDSKSFVIVL